MRVVAIVWVMSALAWECGVTPQWERRLAEANLRARKVTEAPPLERREYLGPLRITPYYGDLTQLEDSVVQHLKEKVIPGVIAWFRSALRVKQVKSNLVISQEQCYNTDVPEKHKTEGVPQTDFVLYIYAAPGSGYNARGGTCAYDPSSLGNPIAGFYEINANAYDSDISDTVAIAIARHEITHALVFTSGNFDLYKQPDGSPYTDLIVVKSARGIEKVSILRAPKATELAKQGFGCDTMEGIQLEDMGGQGTVNSHWDKRIMFDDYMVGNLMQPAIYSKVTLGLFEDSGWYFPVYEFGEELIYGKGEGCSFISEKCVQNDKAAFSEFCDKQNKMMCDFTLTHKAYCNIVNYSSALEDPFAYFSDPTLGGEEKYFDYCPVALGYSNGDCTDETTGTESDNYYGESKGKNSRCFIGSLLSQDYEYTGTVQAGCYKVTCGKTSATVFVGDTEVQCPPDGGEVTEITGFSGSLTCPPFSVLCKAIPCTSACNGVGQCLPSGQCHCNPGYFGPDCSTPCAPACAVCSSTTVCSTCDENANQTESGCECFPGFQFNEQTRRCEASAAPCDPSCASIIGASALKLAKKYTQFSETYVASPTPYVCYEYPIAACAAASELASILGLTLPDDLSTLTLTELQCQKLLYYDLLVAQSWVNSAISSEICEPAHRALVDLVFAARLTEAATWTSFKATLKSHVWGKAWTEDEMSEVEALKSGDLCQKSSQRCEEDLAAIVGQCQ